MPASVESFAIVVKFEYRKICTWKSSIGYEYELALEQAAAPDG